MSPIEAKKKTVEALRPQEFAGELENAPNSVKLRVFDDFLSKKTFFSKKKNQKNEKFKFFKISFFIKKIIN